MDRPRRTKKIPVVQDATPKLSKEERHRIQCAAYRARVKSDLTKDEEFKKKNAEQKRIARLLATPDQKATEREKARLRQAAFRERKKNAKAAFESTSKTPSKAPETRSEAKQAEERRMKNRLAQQKRRANMSSQKKRRERERNNSYMQNRRAPPSSVESTPPSSSQPTPSSVSRSTIHRIKKKMGDQLLVSIKSLVRSTAKKQITDLQNMGITYNSPSKPSPSIKSPVPDMEKRTRAKVCLSAKCFYSGNEGDIDSLYKRRKFKDDGKAGEFLDDNATQIPGKLSVSKNGSRKVLRASVKALYKEFKEKHGALISQATFFRKRPKNILSFTKTPFRQCLCEVCINPMLLMKVLNAFCRVRVETLRDLIGLTVCGVNVECMQRECDSCGVHVIDDMVDSDAWEKETEWQRWGKVKTKGSARLDLLKKSGSVSELCDQLRADLLKLPKHDFVHRWQSSQYRAVVSDIPGNWAVLTMDFAENYLCRQQDQPQSAYFGYTQVTVHPCVLYYKCACGLRVTENWTFLSNILTHSACMEDAIMKKIVSHVCTINIDKLVVYSDGCSSQYKSKLPFQYVSGYASCGLKIERCLFGARHGKNPCDALGGLLKQAASRAVQSRKCVIQNAADLLKFAEDNREMTDLDCESGKSSHSTRSFFLLEEQDIELKNSSNLKTVAGTREVHSIIPTDKGLLFRNLSCFCLPCLGFDYSSCLNQEFVTQWQSPNCKKRFSLWPAQRAILILLRVVVVLLSIHILMIWSNVALVLMLLSPILVMWLTEQLILLRVVVELLSRLWVHILMMWSNVVLVLMLLSPILVMWLTLMVL